MQIADQSRIVKQQAGRSDNALRLDTDKRSERYVNWRALAPVTIQCLEPGQREPLPDVLPGPTGRGCNPSVHRGPIYGPAGGDSPGLAISSSLVEISASMTFGMLRMSINCRTSANVMSG